MNSDIMTKAILEIKEDLGEIKGTTKGIKEKIDAHDSLLDSHTYLLNTIDKRTIGMDSWKNGIIHNIIEEKEKVLATIRQENKDTKESHERRMNLLEDYKDKKEAGAKEVKSKFLGIFWGGFEKVIYIVVGGGVTLLIALKTKYYN